MTATECRRKQYYSLSHARAYAASRSWVMFEMWVVRAARHAALSEHQWFNLRLAAGEDRQRNLRNQIEGDPGL